MPPRHDRMRRLMTEPPRSLQLAARDAEGQVPIGTAHVPPKEVDKRMHPLLGLAAAGHIPVDEPLARYIGDFLQRHHDQSTK